MTARGVASTTDTGLGHGDHGEVDGDQVSVLVVDDGATFRRATAAVLAATEGFVLAGVATSGEEAVTYLEQHRVALVLMDVRMPGMGGIRAAGEIRRRFPGVVVVLLSMYRTHELSVAVASSDAQFCRKDQFGPEQLEKLWHDGRPSRG
jgi:two-component system invasion response regulator UvrY